MLQRNRTTWRVSAGVALLLFAMVMGVAIGASPTLQSVAVTPTAASIPAGQALFFKATGTFSDGSTHKLGPAIADIAPGDFNTCVLLTSGGVKCWGDNQYGQLGDGSTADSLIPRRVKGITKATALGLGRLQHGCVVLASGEVKCWGRNDAGQLGNGTTTDSTVPVNVTAINSATAVAAGGQQTCALLAGGAIQCWGKNSRGELGDGTNASSSVPVSVTGISTATAVATGAQHGCALLASGAVQCWGYNAFGQLGNGTTTDSNTPVAVSGISSATAVAAGLWFSCARLSSGDVQCWGHGEGGELGDGSSEPFTAYSSIPVSVALTSAAVAITAGGWHACVVISSATAQCWGSNYYGELGDALTTVWASSTPVRVSGINASVKLAAGHYYTCALLPDGAMRCWGWNGMGQLGNRRTTNWPTRRPVNVIGTPGVVWKSSDLSKATIIPSGRATGRSSGNTTITATTTGFVNDNAVLTVN